MKEWPSKYPFRTLKVGEEKLVPNAPKDFSNYAYRYGLILQRTFRTETVEGGKILRRIS